MVALLKSFHRCVWLSVSALLLALINSCPASASQLVIKNNCSFVVDVPGVFGPTHLNYSATKGAVYKQDSDGKFCGIAAMQTPMGPSADNKCFVVANGQFISGEWGNKVSSSTCALADEAIVQTPFDEAQAIPFAGTGSANLRGQAFLKTIGGDVKTCAGEDVVLVPSIRYFDDLMDNAKIGIDAHIDPRATLALRKTICDAQGNFTFLNLPTQTWYVLTQVRWGAPHLEQPGERSGLIIGLLFGFHVPPNIDEQGGELLQLVELKAGDNQILLTDRDKR
jgi:hypothetical protein